jgi:hypothetical protein
MDVLVNIDVLFLYESNAWSCEEDRPVMEISTKQ